MCISSDPAREPPCAPRTFSGRVVTDSHRSACITRPKLPFDSPLRIETEDTTTSWSVVFTTILRDGQLGRAGRKRPANRRVGGRGRAASIPVFTVVARGARTWRAAQVLFAFLTSGHVCRLLHGPQSERTVGADSDCSSSSVASVAGDGEETPAFGGEGGRDPRRRIAHSDWTKLRRVACRQAQPATRGGTASTECASAALERAAAARPRDAVRRGSVQRGRSSRGAPYQPQ